MSGDSYQGPPVADLTLDGNPVPSVPVIVQHGTTSQAVSLPAAPGKHVVTIGFSNDAWGGGPDKDRNLYLDGVHGVLEQVAPQGLCSDGGITLHLTVPGAEAALLARINADLADAAAASAEIADLAAPAKLQADLPAQAASLGQAAASTAAAATVAPSVPAAPIDHTPRLFQVGSDKDFKSLTLAMVAMNTAWNNGYAGGDTTSVLHAMISPEAPGYYTNDAGSHSRRWPSMVGWPPWDGPLRGPVIIEGEPGKPAPDLDTDGYADGVLYYQQGLFITSEKDATFRHLNFRGFRRQDGLGNYAGIRIGPPSAAGLLGGTLLVEDCRFEGCDNGVMGEGNPGQSAIFRLCEFLKNGTGEGKEHNVYVGWLKSVLFDRCYSHDANTGHLIKSRAEATTLLGCRLLGGSGTESACLDVPDAGLLTIADTVMEKSAGTDANWIIHYAGENQDAGNGVPFHPKSGVAIRNLMMVAPPAMARHPSWGAIRGFANHSGDGEAACGKGSQLVTPDAQGVQVFGLAADAAGLPCTILAAPPVLDRTPLRQ